MTLKLPSHVQGWKIPATGRAPELTVIYAGSPWGPHYEAGELNTDWTALKPKDVSAWVVEGDTRRGMAVMQFETEGRGRSWEHGFRATAAMLHFCMQADGPDGTGYMPEGGVLYVPRHTAEKTDPGDLIYLRNLGFSALYPGDDLVVRPDHIHSFTGDRFPEFADAELLPSRTEQEEMALAAARLAEQPPAEQ